MRFIVQSLAGGDARIVIDESHQLGRGATAKIYRVEHDGKSWAAKVYSAGRTANEGKLRAMLASPPHPTAVTVGGQEFQTFAWPVSLLRDAYGTTRGYLMPLVNPGDSYPLDHFYDPILFRRMGRPDEAALSCRVEIAANLCAAIAELHSLGHHFIDCKPQNIRVYPGTRLVTLIDCDGFSICGEGVRYSAELLSTDYIAPEVTRENRRPSELGEAQDRYALGVILFQLLNRGTHPFQGVMTNGVASADTNDGKAALGLYPHGIKGDPRIRPRHESLHEFLDSGTRVLFDRAFDERARGERPSARQWRNHFRRILASRAIVACKVKPRDSRHMHFRYGKCAACYTESLTTPVRPAPVTLVPPFRPQLPPKVEAGPSPASVHRIVAIAGAVLVVGVFIALFRSPTGGDRGEPQPEAVAPISDAGTRGDTDVTGVPGGSTEPFSSLPPLGAGLSADHAYTVPELRYCLIQKSFELPHLQNIAVDTDREFVRAAKDSFALRCRVSDTLGGDLLAQVSGRAEEYRKNAEEELSDWRRARAAQMSADGAGQAVSADTVLPVMPVMQEASAMRAVFAEGERPDEVCLYPSASRRLSEAGTVTLLLRVAPDGRVSEAKVVRSSGYQRLDGAAASCMSRLGFVPRTIDGSPTESWQQIQWTWALKKPIDDQPVTPAKFARGERPGDSCSYPTTSRRRGQEGAVTLLVHVRADGLVSETRVEESTGYPVLDDAAADCMRRVLFVPSKVGDRPIDSWQRIKWTWNLGD